MTTFLRLLIPLFLFYILDCRVTLASSGMVSDDLQEYYAEANSKKRETDIIAINNNRDKAFLSKSHSFTSQLSRHNTIYYIQDEFDLEDSVVILPEGSILKFEGGCLKNGCVVTSEGDITICSDGYLFKPGDILDWQNRDIYITGDCLISFANTTEQRSVTISSNKKAKIKIEGYTSILPKFHSCDLIKTSKVLAFNNRLVNNSEVFFDNCNITAEPFSNYTDDNSVIVFQSIYNGINYRLPQGMSITGKITDCTLNNVGLHGYVCVDNCSFLVGEHTMHNIEVIHGGGLICNSTFYNKIKNQRTYSMDIIDVYNHDNFLIDNCKFYDFKTEYLISIKQHYDKNNTPIDKKPQQPMTNITIRNCVFDNSGGDCIYIYTDAGADRKEDYDVRDAGGINILYNTFFLTPSTTKRSTTIFMNATNNINVEGNVFNLTDKGCGNTIFLCSNISNLSVMNNKVRDLRSTSTSYPSMFMTFLTPSKDSYCTNVQIKNNFVMGYIVNVKNLLPYSRGIVNISENYTCQTRSAFNTGKEFYTPQNVDGLVFVCKDNAYHNKDLDLVVKPGLRTLGYSNYKEDIICVVGCDYFDAVLGKHFYWTGKSWVDM